MSEEKPKPDDKPDIERVLSDINKISDPTALNEIMDRTKERLSDVLGKANNLIDNLLNRIGDRERVLEYARTNNLFSKYNAEPPETDAFFENDIIKLIAEIILQEDIPLQNVSFKGLGLPSGGGARIETTIREIVVGDRGLENA